MKADLEGESKSALTSAAIEEIVEDLVKKSMQAYELATAKAVNKIVAAEKAKAGILDDLPGSEPKAEPEQKSDSEPAEAP
jgi:hypothetical protein